MERFLLRIWIFILALGFGISVSAIWRSYTPSVPPNPVSYTLKDLRQPTRAPETPRIVDRTHSCGASAKGQTYTFSDGGQVSISCETFRSEETATRALDKRLSSVTIAQRTVNMDTTGAVLGEEVLITSPTVVKLRKTNNSLCEIQASSLDHLRWFENQQTHSEAIEPL